MPSCWSIACFTSRGLRASEVWCSEELNGETADAVNRSRAAKAEIALQQADAVTGLGQQSPRREPAKPGTDHHGVEFLDLGHVSSRFPREA